MNAHRLILFEDEHLLVVNKPAGWNTHSPSPYAGEGVYEWLKHRSPDWANLAIIHRLDKETSGVLLFSKSNLANRVLTEQFAGRQVRKEYLCVTDRDVPKPRLTVRSALAKAGDRFRSQPSGGNPAETDFEVIGSCPEGTQVVARPVTGRTHQVRVHAAENGFPVLGDILYGGTAAGRIYLHAARLALRHPLTGAELSFEAAVDFSEDVRFALRGALVDPGLTDAYRLVHGAADGWPGWQVDRMGEILLSQSDRPLRTEQRDRLRNWVRNFGLQGVLHREGTRRAEPMPLTEVLPARIHGPEPADEFVVHENGLRFVVRPREGGSAGLFLDQRDNRRRLLTNHVAAGFPVLAALPDRPSVLNSFAYTCGFSVCAAKVGARVTSIDLSAKNLDWGRRNFRVNGLDPDQHLFLRGDVFEWLKRLSKRGARFDLIILDPPTFSRSKRSGAFRVEKDYPGLISSALALLKSGGVLLASANAAGWRPESFLASVTNAVQAAGGKIRNQHYVPQPPDFPVSREEPAYLKTVWLRVEFD